MRALVTGGTGFIGSHLVEALLKKGVEVRCLVRDPARPRWLAGLDVELVRGDCAVAETLEGAASGMDYVFHLAGVTKAARAMQYYRANSEGTRNIAVAAARDAAGLRRFVYVSSQAAAGPSSKGVPRGEDDEPAPVSDYGRSKLLGERHVLALKDRLPVVIVRPTSVYGPRDTDVFTFFKLVNRGIRTSFRSERMVSVCYSADLVEGILAAAFGDEDSGEAYFIADGKPYTWDFIGEAIAAALGKRAMRVVVPLPALGAVAVIAEAFGRLAGRATILNRQKMEEIRQPYWVVDVEKARRALGFSAGTDFATGAALTAAWYREHGWL